MSWWLSWRFVVERFRAAVVWLLNVYLQLVLLFNDKCVFGAMPRVVFVLLVIYLFTFSGVIYIQFWHISIWRHLHQSSRLIYLRRVDSIFSLTLSMLPSSSMWYWCPVLFCFIHVLSKCPVYLLFLVLISLIIYWTPLLYRQSVMVTPRFFLLTNFSDLSIVCTVPFSLLSYLWSDH